METPGPRLSASVEHRRREDRGAERVGCGGVPSQKIFPIFELKKASFDALWVLFFAVELNGNWLRPLSGMH